MPSFAPEGPFCPWTQNTVQFSVSLAAAAGGQADPLAVTRTDPHLSRRPVQRDAQCWGLWFLLPEAALCSLGSVFPLTMGAEFGRRNSCQPNPGQSRELGQDVPLYSQSALRAGLAPSVIVPGHHLGKGCASPSPGSQPCAHSRKPQPLPPPHTCLSRRPAHVPPLPVDPPGDVQPH